MEIAYLAGLFDGEGCIQIARCNKGSIGFTYSLSVKINLQYTKTLQEIHDKFGGSICTTPRQDKCNQWTCCGINANDILKLLLPHLREKKKQAELAIEYIETFGCGRQQCGRGINKRTEIEKQLQELYYLRMRMLKKEKL